MDSSVSQILILLVLLLLSGIFSSAETALTTYNKIRMRALADEGNKRASTVLAVTENSGKMLSAILIGNNIVNTAVASLATTIAYRLGGTAVAIASGLMTLLRIDPNAKDNTMTEAELRSVVNVSHQDGVIESDEKEMIYNVFDLGDAIAKDVMVPRVNVTFADIDSSYDELIDLFREDKFTRLPVYQETKDNVVGTINMKDLLLYDSKKSEFQIKDILREAYFTYEYKSISELLVEMRQASFNIAIVLDEYGETSGLITLEDILEEIVGEIHDEYDENEEENIKAVGKHEYIIEGSTNLDDLNDSLDLNLESEDYDSLGGFIIEKLDRLPKAGDSVSTEEGIRMVVEKLDKNRIETVHLYLPENYREHTSDSLETDD